MSDTNTIVVVYETDTDAEAGVRELQNAGFDMTTLSIAGKENDAEDYVGAHYNSGEPMKHRGKRGGFSGGGWGFLAGPAFPVLPGIGPVLIAGPLADALMARVEGSANAADLNPLDAGLCRLGIPKNRIHRYETCLMENKFLLIAHGAAQDLLKARDILRSTRPEELNLHFTEEAVLAHY